MSTFLPFWPQDKRFQKYNFEMWIGAFLSKPLLLYTSRRSRYRQKSNFAARLFSRLTTTTTTILSLLSMVYVSHRAICCRYSTGWFIALFAELYIDQYMWIDRRERAHTWGYVWWQCYECATFYKSVFANHIKSFVICTILSRPGRHNKSHTVSTLFTWLYLFIRWWFVRCNQQNKGFPHIHQYIYQIQSVIDWISITITTIQDEEKKSPAEIHRWEMISILQTC